MSSSKQTPLPRLTTSLLSVALPIAVALGQKPPPAVIKDINTLSDGRGSNPPPADPNKYPLTASSYPDTPRVIGNLLYFLAQDGSGRRRLWSYNAPTSEVLVVDLAGGSNPRLLTLYVDKLYCVCDVQPDPTLPQTRPIVLKVTGTSSTKINFDNSPTLNEISGMTADGGQLAVLVIIASTSTYHSLQTFDGSKFTSYKDSNTTYSEAADLISVAGTFAFTAQRKAQTGPRSLYVCDVNPFTEVSAGSPAYLTRVDTSTVTMIDKANALDRLRVFIGSAIDTKATRDGIQSLTVGTAQGKPTVFFVSGVNTASTIVESWDSDQGVVAPAPLPGNTVASVASIGTASASTFVLGVAKDDFGVRVTTLWRFVDDVGGVKNVLVPQATFDDLVAAHDLHVFVDTGGGLRAAFVAVAKNQSSLRPRLMLSKPADFTNWDSVEVPGVVPGGTVDQLRRVGDYLFFRATHFALGSEPWQWYFR